MKEPLIVTAFCERCLGTQKHRRQPKGKDDKALSPYKCKKCGYLGYYLPGYHVPKK